MFIISVLINLLHHTSRILAIFFPKSLASKFFKCVYLSLFIITKLFLKSESFILFNLKKLMVVIGKKLNPATKKQFDKFEMSLCPSKTTIIWRGVIFLDTAQFIFLERLKRNFFLFWLFISIRVLFNYIHALSNQMNDARTNNYIYSIILNIKLFCDFTIFLILFIYFE